MSPAWPAGYGLTVCEEIDSTNAEALRLAATGEPGPLWVRAIRQLDGRGRRGRNWVSPPGNLYASLLIRPPKPKARSAQLSFAAALAASDMLAGFAPNIDIRVKWPNDVLADGGKIVGILLEAAPAEDALVIGIGVNLVSTPTGTPYPAASLTGQGVAPPPPEEALKSLAAAFSRWYEDWLANGFSPLREAWLARATGLGCDIHVRLPDRELSGCFEGVDADGALLLSRGGAVRTIAAGDVFFP